MISNVNLGRPGVGGVTTAQAGFVFENGDVRLLAGSRVLDGAKCRDAGNAPDTRTLRPALLLGKVTATGKYAPATVGKTLAAVAANATSLTLTPAAAAELRRRVGASGSLVLVGPPAAGGTVATQTVAYSAVNEATGVVTTSAIPAAVVTDSRVGQADGTVLPLTVVDDGYGFIIPTSGDLELAYVPVDGQINESRIPDWPADAASRAALRAQLRVAADFKFTGDF